VTRERQARFQTPRVPTVTGQAAVAVSHGFLPVHPRRHLRPARHSWMCVQPPSALSGLDRQTRPTAGVRRQRRRRNPPNNAKKQLLSRHLVSRPHNLRPSRTGTRTCRRHCVSKAPTSTREPRAVRQRSGRRARLHTGSQKYTKNRQRLTRSHICTPSPGLSLLPRSPAARPESRRSPTRSQTVLGYPPRPLPRIRRARWHPRAERAERSQDLGGTLGPADRRPGSGTANKDRG
jgi:hypothetical protein